MLVQHARLRIALVFISTVTAGGCAVGTAYVNAPARLPAQAPPDLARRISFDVCVAPEPRPNRRLVDHQRREAGDRVRRALWHAGVRADLTADAGSPVDFTVTLHEELGPMGSVALSLLTFSVVPGYAVERKTLNVDVAERDAAGGEATVHLAYQARTTLLIWLPLIVAPDIIVTLSGGWQTPELTDGGFRQMMRRLADDLRVELNHDRTELPARQTPGVKCGNSLAHAASEPPLAGTRDRGLPVAAGLR